MIQPPPGSKPGERVYFEGPDYESMLLVLLEPGLCSRSAVRRATALPAEPKEENL